jgi:hypothetical protein
LAELLNAAKMSSAAEFRSQPYPDNVFRNTHANNPFTHTQHVGIIMLTTHPGGVMIMTESCPDMPVSIGRHGHPDTGPANQDTTVHCPGIHLFTDQSGNIRIINGLHGVAAQIMNPMAKVSHQDPYHFFEVKATMIRTNCYLHITLL